MKSRSTVAAGGLIAAGSLLGFLLGSLVSLDLTPRVQAEETAPQPDDLQARVAKLEGLLTQATAMRDIDYHAQNLWFSGRAGNWALAKYYWDATKTHMQLAAERPGSDGKVDPNLKAIAQSIEQSPNMQIGKAIDRRDVVVFQTHYRGLLEGCYACHKAAGKPFLRPRMPVKPHQAMINVDPTATWPQ